jgi:hypothetical protein
VTIAVVITVRTFWVTRIGGVLERDLRQAPYPLTGSADLGAASRYLKEFDEGGRTAMADGITIAVPEGWVALDRSHPMVSRTVRQNRVLDAVIPVSASLGIALWRPSLSGGGSWIVIGTCTEDAASAWQRHLALVPWPSGSRVTRDSVAGGPCPMARGLVHVPAYEVDGLAYESALLGWWLGPATPSRVIAVAGVAEPADEDRAMLDRLLGHPSGQRPAIGERS